MKFQEEMTLQFTMRNHVRVIRYAWMPLLVAGLFLLPLSRALAVPISVANHSFEELPVRGLPSGCGAGCTFSVGDFIPGWTNDPTNSGQFRPGTDVGNFFRFDTLSSDGTPTNAYTNGGDITQTVGATVQAGVTYTLQVDVGQRKDCCALGSVELLIGGNPILATGLAPTVGNWSTFTATYTGLAVDAGESIAIGLVRNGGQSNFDNVRLNEDTASAVPEPSTLLLLGAGLVPFGLIKRKFNLGN